MNIKVYVPAFLLILAGVWMIYANNFSNSSLSNSNSQTLCNQPLTYRLGEIDSRFNISRKEVITLLKEVEGLWNTALEKDLVAYSQNGKVAINLVYSNDQQRTDVERQLSRRIETKERQVATLKREYGRLSERYQQKKEEAKQTLNKHKSAVESYNQLAAEWYGKQVPQDVINRFESLERKAVLLETALTRKEQNLESLRQRTNAKTKQLNNVIREQHNLVKEYNDRFSKPRKFDQGRYLKQGDSEQIAIYQFRNQGELKTVLTHEVGHALGLVHVSNPEAVMHDMMGQQNIFDLQLTEDDITAIRTLCKGSN